MKKLNNILTHSSIIEHKGNLEVEVKSVGIDSRKVESGQVFFAIPGTQVDGHQFIPQAVEAGAAAIVCERIPDVLADNVTYVRVENISKVLGFAVAEFYDNPSEKLILVGVTGTNGKTTTATLLYQLFRKLGYKAGLLSTVVNCVDDKATEATQTTPDAVTINRLLHDMVAVGCSYAFMEVSSHSIAQHRVAGLYFAGGVFSNITHDHLDYHKTFDEYLKVKKSFFDGLPATSFALVNVDDRNGRVMVQNTKATAKTYALKSMADYKCKIIENGFEGMHLNIDGTEVWTEFIGEFNAYNLLAVYAAARQLNVEKEEALTTLSMLKPVSGRFECVRSANGITAIIDFAHTPDALENVLKAINSIRKDNERLITVAGCGGNKDKTKRPIMAALAVDYSDVAVLTSDNPRFEDPEAILEDMKAGLTTKEQRSKALSIVNRHEAIRTAVTLAKPNDIILLAGKGHETHQEIMGVRTHFDDKEEVLNAFKEQE